MKEKTVLGLIVLLGLVSAQQIATIPTQPIAGLPTIITLSDINLSQVQQLTWTISNSTDSFTYTQNFQNLSTSANFAFITFPFQSKGNYTISVNILYQDNTTQTKNLLITIDKAVQDFEAQLNTLTSSTQNLSNNIYFLANNVASINTNIANLSNLTISLNNSIQSLQSQLNSQQQALNALSGRATNLENRASTLESKANTFDSQIAQLNSNLNGYNNQTQAQILSIQSSINQLTNATQTTLQYIKAQDTVNLIFFVVAVIDTVLVIFLFYKSRVGGSQTKQVDELKKIIISQQEQMDNFRKELEEKAKAMQELKEVKKKRGASETQEVPPETKGEAEQNQEQKK